MAQNPNDKKEQDQLSGAELRRHEWDGIQELNNPLPRWWLWLFYITIIWSIGYWVVYPAWPTLSGSGERGGTQGVMEWTQYKELDQQRAEIVKRRGEYLERFRTSDYEDIMNDPELYAFALAGGQAAFKENCATCHGTGGAGAKGYPNLNDDDWIWAGDLDGIYQTIKYGIRMNEDARDSIMPSYNDILSGDEIRRVSEYVQGLHTGESTIYPQGLTSDTLADVSMGARLFYETCAACHGNDGRGNREIGAPNLADAIWLNSKDGSIGEIMSQLKRPRHGMMPAWVDRLDENSLRQLTIYVHELGGGE